MILEEGNLPHPQCPMCNILVQWQFLNGSHNGTVQCEKGAEQKQRLLASEEAMTVTSRSFSAYGPTLKMVTSFKYLGRVLLASDDDWPAVV